MKQMLFTDPAALSAACEVLRGPLPVFMLELPAVFALVTSPTRRGAAALDAVKRRLPGKTYGSLIGDLAAFRGLVRDAELPPALRAPGALKAFDGAFMRIQVGPPEARTPAVVAGTHQGLLVSGAHRAFFTALEAALRPLVEPDLFCGKVYSAALATSANWSGDPQGSITTWERAEPFARARDLPLILRCAPEESAPGSFPIFQLRSSGISQERSGPREAEVRARVEALLGSG